jgi:hypothetical protein
MGGSHPFVVLFNLTPPSRVRQRPAAVRIDTYSVFHPEKLASRLRYLITAVREKLEMEAKYERSQ